MSEKCITYRMVAARILLSAVFIMAGINKLMDFSGSVAYTASALPAPELMTVLAIIFELGGGLMILLGYHTAWAARALILFTLVATFAFHFNFSDPMQAAMFMKNLAIVGGLILLCSHGAGTCSVDAKCCKKKETSVEKEGQ